MKRIEPIFLIWFIAGCSEGADNSAIPIQISKVEKAGSYKSIGEIPVPQGFQRVNYESGSFGFWLRELPLKKRQNGLFI